MNVHEMCLGGVNQIALRAIWSEIISDKYLLFLFVQLLLLSPIGDQLERIVLVWEGLAGLALHLRDEDAMLNGGVHHIRPVVEGLLGGTTVDWLDLAALCH